jgi:hypothetical protein
MDIYQCPEGNKVTFGGCFDKQKKTVRIYKGIRCLDCQSQRECTKRRGGIRYLKILPHEGERNAMIAKMKTEQAKVIYPVRKAF